MFCEDRVAVKSENRGDTKGALNGAPFSHLNNLHWKKS
jgi:hypothetical protein